MPIRPEMRARYPTDWKLRSRFVRFYRARQRCHNRHDAKHRRDGIRERRRMASSQMDLLETVL